MCQTTRKGTKQLEKVTNILRRYQTTREGIKQQERETNNQRKYQTTREGTKQQEKEPNNYRRFTKQLEKVPNIQRRYQTSREGTKQPCHKFTCFGLLWDCLLGFFFICLLEVSDSTLECSLSEYIMFNRNNEGNWKKFDFFKT